LFGMAIGHGAALFLPAWISCAAVQVSHLAARYS
jgi:hypothetical protein